MVYTSPSGAILEAGGGGGYKEIFIDGEMTNRSKCRAEANIEAFHSGGCCHEG